MLDTNICIYLINKKSPSLISRFKQEEPRDIAPSSITLAELEFVAHNGSDAGKNLFAIAKFTAPMAILPFGEAETDTYGKIRAKLQRIGNPIGPMDAPAAAEREINA